MRKILWLVVVLVALGVVGFLAWPKQEDSQAEVVSLMQKGDFPAAEKALEEVENPSAELVTAQLLIQLGLLGADVQLLQEYDTLVDQFHAGMISPEDALTKYRTARFDLRANDTEELQQIASKLQKTYKAGAVRLPWPHLVLEHHNNENTVISSLNALRSGQFEEEHFQVLEKAVEEISVLGVMQGLISGQEQGSQKVSLRGKVDMAALMLYVGGRLSDDQLRTWYMNQVIDLSGPDSELGKQAQDVLSR